MHFTIPDIQQLSNRSGNSYTGYNIHINGCFHCTTRYKQLLSLHEQLHSENTNLKFPTFPPKKLLPLTSNQLEDRRLLLEKYMQYVGQNPVLSNSDILISFLALAQQETHDVRMHEVDIEVFLMHGYRIPLSVSSTDRSDRILDIACSNINLPSELTKYFSLFLINWSCAKHGNPALKKLEEYESPYISQRYVHPEDKIVLRKSYWDPVYDVDLMIDKVSLDLLYLQIISEIDLGWMPLSSNSRERLLKYKENKQKREYIELARTLRHYGRVPAGDVIVERWGAEGSAQWSAGGRMRVALVGKELVLTTASKELRFKVTRMRCWRITTLHQDNDRIAINGRSTSEMTDSVKHLELSFEYLISKDHLQWITLRTEHATYISIGLQSIVDELMRQKGGAGPAVAHTTRRPGRTYLRRDGSARLLTPSSSTDTLSSNNGDSITSSSSKETFSIRKLSEKFASVAFKAGRDCVENNAFEEIGDDDL